MVASVQITVSAASLPALKSYLPLPRGQYKRNSLPLTRVASNGPWMPLKRRRRGRQINADCCKWQRRRRVRTPTRHRRRDSPQERLPKIPVWSDVVDGGGGVAAMLLVSQEVVVSLAYLAPSGWQGDAINQLCSYFLCKGLAYADCKRNEHKLTHKMQDV